MVDKNDLTVMARMDWPHNPPDIFCKIGDKQSARLSLRMKLILAKADPRSPVTLWVSLEDTEISPGSPPEHKEDSHHGWFQDRVEVSMSLVRRKDVPLSQIPGALQAAKLPGVHLPDPLPTYPMIPEMRRISDGPQTWNGSGSVTSSVSFSFTASFSGGFFGDVPTANVSAGGGVNISHSFSRTMQDFETKNETAGDKTDHTYFLTMSSIGAYTQPRDLVPDPDSMDFTAHFKGIKIGVPPPLATANMEIISQGVWQATHNKDIAEDALLRVVVVQHVADVEGTNQFVAVGINARSKTATYTVDVPIPFKQLAAQAKAVL
jgi:hypothetical protein